MSRKFTKRQKFLKILKKDKYYRGDVKFTINLYKKFLRIYKECGRVNASTLFECNTVRNIDFFKARGFNDEDAKKALKNIQGRGYDKRSKASVEISNLKRKNTLSKKTKEEINIINSKKGKGYCPDYISKKYNITVEEAIQKIDQRKIQKVKSFNTFLKKSGGYKREWSSRCAEFWTSRGYTLEEAKQAIKHRSDTRSLRSIASRLNISLDEAKKIQHEVANKCRETYNAKTNEERRDILIKRTKNSKKFSKRATIFFDRLYKDLIDLNLTWLYKENEYFLWGKDNNGKNRIYFYDLTIPEINIIIEYNGIIYHPREKDTWITTVEESIKKDNIKKQIAENNNYKLFYVWDNENEEVALSKIKAIIIEEYDNR
jgi:hypothetical protein